MNKIIPIALTIAGSDSGGGAGIQADLKTFTTHHIFGTSALTCITAQNPDGVTAISEIPLDIIEKQIMAVIDFFQVNAVKTGMLYSKEIIELVSKIFENKKINLIVDPVMVATSGSKLLKDDAISSIKENLIPNCSLFTPNLDEAEILLGKKIISSDELEDAARDLYLKYKTPVLLKGGHLKDTDLATDILYDGNYSFPFNSKFIKEVNTHGTGCTYSSSIAANLAKGFQLMESVSLAKYFIYETISQPIFNGKHFALNHNPENTE